MKEILLPPLSLFTNTSTSFCRMRQYLVLLIIFGINVVVRSQNSTSIPKIYENPDSYASFPGGDAALKRFIDTTLIYPPVEKDSGISASIIVHFIVDKTGKILNPKVGQPVKWHSEFSDAAIALINKMPDWIPGKRGIVFVPTRQEIEIEFSLPSAKHKDDSLIRLGTTDVILIAPNQVKAVSFPEQQPEFPGGEAALMKYFCQNIRYPALEKDNNVQGTVILTFLIDKNGNISNIKIIKTVQGGPNLDKEAVRIVKLMPPWIPGKIDGKPADVQYNLPVTFTIR